MATTESVPRAAAAADIISSADPRLANEDLVPTPRAERTWTTWSFAALWMGMVHNILAFTVLEGLVGEGMQWWQVLLVTTTSNIVAVGLMALTGRVGSRFGIPFAVWARAAFGPLGSNIVALTRAIVAIGYFGIQTYLGATAINVLVGTVWGGYHSLGNTVWGGVGLDLWIAMIVYWIANLVIVLRGVETIRRFETWAGPAVFIVMLGLVVWAIEQNHGLGFLFHASAGTQTAGHFFVHAFIPGVALFLAASWATMVLNLPDITRFATSNRAQVRGTLIGLPVASLVFYVMILITVSGTAAATGKPIWNPAEILVAIDVPVVTLVGALTLAIATMSVNVPANIISPAYDLTNALPRFLTFKRAGALSVVIGFAYMPWKLMESPETLFEVLNNVGALMGPATAILIADFYIVRRRRLEVEALYRFDGRYEAQHGFNVVSIGALVLAVIVVISGEIFPLIDWTYTYAWFVGFGCGFVFYLAGLRIRMALAGGTPAEFQPVGSPGAEHEPAWSPAPVAGGSGREAPA